MISQFSSKFCRRLKKWGGGTGTGPMMKGMGVWEVMQAYAGSEVATGSWRVHLSQDDIGSVGSCGSCSCRRKRTLRMSAAS
jgi:hypothetical protein